MWTTSCGFASMCVLVHVCRVSAKGLSRMVNKDAVGNRITWHLFFFHCTSDKGAGFNGDEGTIHVERIPVVPLLELAPRVMRLNCCGKTHILKLKVETCGSDSEAKLNQVKSPVHSIGDHPLTQLGLKPFQLDVPIGNSITKRTRFPHSTYISTRLISNML